MPGAAAPATLAPWAVVTEPRALAAPLDVRRERLTLLAMCFGLFMIMLDNTIVNVAMPSMQRDLRVGPDTLAWTVNAYVVPFAALILLGGKLGDRFGPRRMFVVGLGIFTAGSAACALSTTAGALVAARAVQGTGAALMNPLSLSILVATLPPRRLPAAIGVWAGISGLGLAVGPLLGRLLVERVDWAPFLDQRAGRRPCSRRDAARGARVPRPHEQVARHARRDARHARTRLRRLGTDQERLAWLRLRLRDRVRRPRARARRPVPGLGRRTPTPMLPLGFFARRQFSASDALILLVGFAMFGAIYYGALFLQNIQGYSALQAGVRTLPWMMMILVVAPLAGRLNGKVGARASATAGLLLLTVGRSGLARLAADSQHSSIWPWFVLCGVGTALAMPTVTAAEMGAVPAVKAGVASGVLNMARQVGGALGIACSAPWRPGASTPAGTSSSRSSRPPLRAQAERLGELVKGGQVQAVGRLGGPVARQAAETAFMSGLHAAVWTASALCVLASAIALFGLSRATDSDP
jgi:predicted MFS family arabinose efflux permease